MIGLGSSHFLPLQYISNVLWFCGFLLEPTLPDFLFPEVYLNNEVLYGSLFHFAAFFYFTGMNIWRKKNISMNLWQMLQRSLLHTCNPHVCVSELVHAHSPNCETFILDEAGSKCHIQSFSSNGHRPFLSRQWPAYCYVIIMEFTCIFPVIQLPWMTIMQFRHCLLFNYWTYLYFPSMRCLPLKPSLWLRSFFVPWRSSWSGIELTWQKR